MEYEGEAVLLSYGDNPKYRYIRLAIEDDGLTLHPFRGADHGFENGQRLHVKIVAIANDETPLK